MLDDVPEYSYWTFIYLNIDLQEAMESSAFRNKIKVKLVNLKVYKVTNIFMPPKITQKRIRMYVFSLETSGKHPCLFYLLLRGKYIHKKNSM